MKRPPGSPADRRRRRRGGLQFWGFVAGYFVLGGAIWLGVSALAGILLPSWGPDWRGLVSFWATLVVLILSAVLWGRSVGRRRPDVFGPFNEALLKIARGDYSAQVPVEALQGGGPAESFQTMALNLNAMAGSLARMEALRQQFVADVSHEFQSPLTSILGFAQALRSELPSAMKDRYLGIIEAEARRLSRLSDTLLKLNALEDRQGPPDPASFRLDVQLRRVIVALEPQWAAKSLDVEAELEPLDIVGNEELWTQVWTNLLHNAIKFTPGGGRILVRLSVGAGWEVSVEDSGIGLSPGESDRVFERFYKGDSARTHGEPASGSGLGLALVHRIVTLHGGRVEALSPGLGLGTTLKVTSSPGP